jgi:hypothetical protein
LQSSRAWIDAQLKFSLESPHHLVQGWLWYPPLSGVPFAVSGIISLVAPCLITALPSCWNNSTHIFEECLSHEYCAAFTGSESRIKMLIGISYLSISFGMCNAKQTQCTKSKYGYVVWGKNEQCHEQ